MLMTIQDISGEEFGEKTYPELLIALATCNNRESPTLSLTSGTIPEDTFKARFRCK
jgi:hypothetical protein